MPRQLDPTKPRKPNGEIDFSYCLSPVERLKAHNKYLFQNLPFVIETLFNTEDHKLFQNLLHRQPKAVKRFLKQGDQWSEDFLDNGLLPLEWGKYVVCREILKPTPDSMHYVGKHNYKRKSPKQTKGVRK
jgi:hypothetical protein